LEFGRSIFDAVKAHKKCDIFYHSVCATQRLLQRGVITYNKLETFTHVRIFLTEVWANARSHSGSTVNYPAKSTVR